MPLFIVENDITKMTCDAIVNAANSSLLGGGGVDGAIHRAAGPKLLAECRGLHGCKTGDAKITGGYDLPSRYVIHTVGPVWNGGSYGEEELLRSCYSRSLALALEHGCETVAFPLISTGVYGYPKREGFRVAREEITSFLEEHDMTVYIVIFGAGAFDIDPDLRSDISSLLSGRSSAYGSSPKPGSSGLFRGLRSLKRSVDESAASVSMEEEVCEAVCDKVSAREMRACAASEAAAMPMAGASSDMADLKERLSMLDESFSQMLLRKIDELGMTDVECYKKANLDRKHFSKIRSDRNYRPKKMTVLALGVAMKLPKSELTELLMKAGYALSDSDPTDVIIGYFISKGNYNVYDINEALFAFDRPMLGA